MELLAEHNPNGRPAWLGALLWAAFLSGLIIQVFAPRLRIQDNKFEIPSTLIAGRNEVRPDEIVGRERRAQVLSGILTLFGACGLAFYYRHVLVGPRSSEIRSKGNKNDIQ